MARYSRGIIAHLRNCAAFLDSLALRRETPEAMRHDNCIAWRVWVDGAARFGRESWQLWGWLAIDIPLVRSMDTAERST